MDLSSGLWETFLLVNPPLVRSFYLVGTLLSSALGFSELEVKIFPNPPGLDTLPQWILTEGVEPSPAIVVNGVATILIVLSLIAVFISQRLRRNND
jgi:putative spermidine/putrescine transport system permease protein